MAVSVSVCSLIPYGTIRVLGLEFVDGVASAPGLSRAQQVAIGERFPDAVIRNGSGVAMEAPGEPAKLFDLPGLDDRALVPLARLGITSEADFAEADRATLLRVPYVTKRNVADLQQAAREAIGEG